MIQGTGTAVQDKAVPKIHRAEPATTGAAAADVHSPVEAVRGKVVAGEEAYCRAQHWAAACCKAGRVEQVSHRREDSPGCSRGPTWLSGDAGGRPRRRGR